MNDNYLQHYGVKGMRWGHRKNIYDVNANYYNKQASKLSARANRNRTMAGMNKRAASQGSGLISKANSFNANYYNKRADKLTARANKNKTMASMNEAASKQKNDAKNRMTPEEQAAKRKKALKVGAAVVGTALAAYGTYKMTEFIKDKNVQIAHQKGWEATKKFRDNKNGYSYTTFKDGSSQLTRIVGDKSKTITYKNADHDAVKKRANEAMARYNQRMADKEFEVRTAYVNRAVNDSLGTATKNVYNYYKDRRRR